MTLPVIRSNTLTDVNYLIDTTLSLRGEDVVLDSTNVDSGSSPTYRFRPGNVVVKRTSTGKYIEANDANGDRNTAPAMSTTGHTDGNGVIKLVGNHGTISVTTTTGSGTEANNATDLNADTAFHNFYVASSGGGELTITARNTGAEEWFYIHTDTMATAPFSEGIDNGVGGSTADYRVCTKFVDLQDINGSAIDAECPTLVRGYFDESELINLTDEAKAVLLSRGSRFG